VCALAPTQTGPAFVIAQSLVLAAFVALGIAATRKFHPVAAAARSYGWVAREHRAKRKTEALRPPFSA
jgi:hypothetical protein